MSLLCVLSPAGEALGRKEISGQCRWHLVAPAWLQSLSLQLWRALSPPRARDSWFCLWEGVTGQRFHFNISFEQRNKRRGMDFPSARLLCVCLTQTIPPLL